MARPPATETQRRQARNSIRRAAAELATEGGATSVTVRKVATRAGVSVGTVYTHFDNLSTLMRSLWTPVIDEADRKLTVVAETHPDPLDRIRAMLHEYATLAGSNEALHRNTLLFVRPADAPAPDTSPAHDLALHRLLTEAILDGQANDMVIDGDPIQLAELMWAGVHGALALPVNADIYELQPARQQVALMIDLLLTSLRR